jgi:prevent-host-death family protein
MKKAPASESTISTNDLRFAFERVIAAVKKGRTLTLTYRNKPLARIVPFSEVKKLAPNDTLHALADLAEPMGQLTNEEMDRLIYDR